MRISILGGTGDIGEGLALRWASDTDHDVVIGSRDPEKARMKADEYEVELDSRGVDRSLTGFVNEMAAERGDVVVLAVPPYHVKSTVETVADHLDGCVLVSPAVGMSHDDDGFHYDPPSVGSVTELVAETAPREVPVVGAFHTLPAGLLADLDLDLAIDTVVVGNDANAKATVVGLADEIDGLRALDGGSIVNAAEMESVTPLLINLAMNNRGMHDLGVRFQ